VQTKLGSVIEALANIVVGFAINWCANMVILPWFGFNIKPLAAFNMGLVFTAVSLARSYVLRRWFNGLKFGNAEGAK
jgi:hypothetical protein